MAQAQMSQTIRLRICRFCRALSFLCSKSSFSVWGQADCMSLSLGPTDDVKPLEPLEPSAGGFMFGCRGVGVVENEEEKYVEGRIIDSGDLNV